MSFSQLEKSLILLRGRHEWSRAVAVAVQARFDRHGRPELFTEPESERHMRNFVFIADYRKDYYNTTAFVSFFKLTELEYCLLHDLEAIRSPTESEKIRLRREYQGSIYPLSPAAQEFARDREALFGDFSRTTVLDMRCLGPQRAYFTFYRLYYLPALQLCGRKQAPQLHEAMNRLGNVLELQARENEARTARAQVTEPCMSRHPGNTTPCEFACRPTPALLGVHKNYTPYTDPPTPLPYQNANTYTPNRYTPRF
jgi:hypothetical protein